MKNPGISAVALLSLAVGIGANTAIFTLVNEVLLRPLAVRNPGELVLLRTIEGARGPMSRGGENNGFIDPGTGRFGSTSFSLLTFERLQSRRAALSDLFAFAPFSQVNVIVDGHPEVAVSAQFVSGSYYGGLGVPAVLGRTIGAEDDRPDSTPVAVVSYRYWDRRFQRNPGVLGQVIYVNRVPTTIVGVTPRGFDGTLQAGESPDVSVPLAGYLRFQPDRPGRARASYWWIRIMGRLAPGATPDQVRAALEPLVQAAAREGWEADRSPNSAANEAIPDPPTLVADRGSQGENDTRRQFAAPLRMLMILTALVLAAACANVANLLLARGVARRREIAVRRALGATGWRIVRQLFAEALLLAATGTALGTLLAWWGRDLLLALRPFGYASVVLDLPMDARVLGFTIALTVITAVICGLAPAPGATEDHLSSRFQSGARTIGSRGGSQITRWLTIVQIALSLVLLVSTGLFVRTVLNLQNVDAGFRRQNLILFSIDAASAGYTRDRFDALQARLQERLERLPGVSGATYSSVALLSNVRQNKRVVVPGRAVPAAAAPIVNTNGLAPNFFAVMQLPIVRGRGFSDGDDLAAPRVAVVNETFARSYLEGDHPVGRVIRIGPAPDDEVQIVGVAHDAKYTDLRSPVPATIYLPARQRLDGNANFAVRVTPSPSERGSDAVAAAFAAIRVAVRDVDPLLPVLNLRTQDEQIDRLNAQPLLFARLSALFGLVAVALASLGLYGVMSHAVARRTAEIGVRMALGASPADVRRMVLGESLALLCAGIVTGAAVAYGAARLVTAMLFGLAPGNPFIYGAAAVTLAGVGLLASVIPARRASRIDPIVALSAE